MIAHWIYGNLYGLVRPFLESTQLAASPWIGKLAFASVFIILIGWLIWIPTDKLRADDEPDEHTGVPSVAQIRILAIVIAAIQAGLYLFWS